MLFGGGFAEKIAAAPPLPTLRMSYDRPAFGFPSLTPAIARLLLGNAIVFVANMLLLGRLSDSAAGQGGFWFAFSWEKSWEGYGLGLLRLLTYQFTHSFGSPMHFLLNALTLYFFGTMAEARLGYRGTFRLYVLGGIAGALLHLGIVALQGNANVSLVGASGSCYAFLLYATCMAPKSQVIFIIVPMQLWVLAALLVGLGIYGTFVEFATGFPGGVSHGAHLGGAALGYAAWRRGWFQDFVPFAYQQGLWARLRAAWLRRREQRHRQVREARELQLDEILAKVKAQGMTSLTPAERAFLQKASEQARRP